MNMTAKVPVAAEDTDLQLIALMISMQLRDEYGLTSSPELTEIVIAEADGKRGDADRLQLVVALDDALSVRVDQIWPTVPSRKLRDLTDSAGQILGKVAATIGESSNIREMLSEVREAIDSEMAQAIKEGLSCHLISLGLLPINAWTHDLTVVEARISITTSSSANEPLTIKAEDAEDVAAAFADFRTRRIGRS